MKVTKKAVLASVCLLSCALMIQAAWTTKRLTQSAGDSKFPDVAVWGSNVYVVWEDRTQGNPDVYFQRSLNGGLTWQSAKKLTSNSLYFSGTPRIAVSGPNVYVVYYDDHDIFFLRSPDGGASWGSKKRLMNDWSLSFAPAVAAYGSNVYVVWYDEKPGNFDIYFRKSADRGVTWKTVRRLTQNTSDSTLPDIAVSGSNVGVVWQDPAPGNREIYFRKSPDGGETWPAPKRLTNNNGVSRDPAITLSGSKAFAVWADDSDAVTNQEIYFKESTDGGATWLPAARLTENSGRSRNPAVDVSGSNYFVTWDDDFEDPLNYEIYLRKSTDGGVFWRAANRLTGSTGWAESPRVAANDTTVFVVWMDDRSGNYEIYIKYAPF